MVKNSLSITKLKEAFFLLKANESSGFDDLNVKCCQEMLWRNQ